MLPSTTHLCSSSFSYLVNYEIQSALYDWFDKVTDERKELKVSAVGVHCFSTIITTATRISGIVETFFGGFLILFCVPFNKKFDEAKIGLHEIFVHTPKNILRTLVIPFGFFGGLIFNLCEPKYFTKITSNEMKANVIHARKGTIGTSAHRDDLCEADGISKGAFLKWQSK
ncbi:MAG TPA: hypothetical protein PLC42_05185 [Parachlamydiaceae bacterium]|nr:hypothetical protein [Parachlamydiaceae bacterium]